MSSSQHQNINEFIDAIYDLIPKLAKDTNYLVRFKVTEKLNEILCFPNIDNKFRAVSVNIFDKLIEDPEPEIRND